MRTLRKTGGGRDLFHLKRNLLRLSVIMVFALFQFNGAWAEDATFEQATTKNDRWQSKTDETSGITVTFVDVPGDNKVHKVAKDEVFSIESTKSGVNITAVKINIGGTDYSFSKVDETQSTLTTTEFGATKVSIKATAQTSVGTITVTYTTGGVVTTTTYDFSVTPTDKATNVAINTPIVLTADGTGTLALADGKTGVQVKAGETTVSGTATIAGNVLTFTPSAALAYDTEYTVSVAAGDYTLGTATNTNNAITTKFTTEAAPVAEGFDLSLSAPSATTDVNVNTNITIAWTAKAKADVAYPITITCEDGTSFTEQTNNGSNRKLTVTRTMPLKAGKTYTIRIPAGAFNVNNEPNKTFEASFTTTATQFDITGMTTPKADATDVVISTEIIVNTGKTIKYNDLSGVKLTADNGAEVEGTVTLSDKNIVLTPAADLDKGTKYTITVPADALSTSSDGTNKLYTASFTTIEQTRPRFVMTTPNGNEEYIPINTKVVLTPSTSVSLTEVSHSMTVKNGDTVVEGTFAMEGNTLVFIPKGNLEFNTEYTVSVPAGAYKFGDEDCEEYKGTFTTMENAKLVNPNDGDLAGGYTFDLGNITLIYGGDGDRVDNAVWSYLAKENKESYGSKIVYTPAKTKWNGKSIRRCDEFDAVNEYCVYDEATQKASYGDYIDRPWGWKTRAGEFDHTLHLMIPEDLVWQKTFHQPCYGNIMFEPKADGVLTVYVEQQGALNYKEGSFIKDVLRKRPIYIVGESGKLVEDVKATTISYIGTKEGNTENNFAQITDNDLKADDMYTKEQAQALRAMYAQWLEDNKEYVNDKDYPSQGVIRLHHHSGGADVTDEVKVNVNIDDGTTLERTWKYTPEFKKLLYKVNGCDANGDGVISDEENDKYNDGSGFMLIDEGYVAYTFNVKAGKTYNIFGYRTKIGYVGFKFEQDENYSPKTITLDDNADNIEAIKAAAGDGGAYPNNQAYDVTLKRKFIANQWQTLVLPFSVGQTEIKKIFGDGTQIVHFTRYNKDNNTLYLRRHVMQMIVGGTPVLIKPTKVDNEESVVFHNVHFVGDHIDLMSPQTLGANPCTITGTYKNGVTVPAKSFFISGNDGNVFQTTKDRNDILAFRAWIQGLSESVSGGKTAQFLDFGDIPEDEVTGITNALIGETKPVTGNIYNMNGQLVRKNATSVEGLPKGIYIMNGSKVIVK